MVTTLDTGDIAAVTGRFYDEDGVLADPATVTLTIVPPDGVQVPVPGGFDHPSTGIYTYSVLLDQTGLWEFRWETDNPTSVAQGSILAGASILETTPTSVVTVEQYRWLTKDWDTPDGDVLHYLADAQMLVEDYLRRLLTSMERTEAVALWYDPATGQSFVAPLATPVTSVPASAAYTIEWDGFALAGVTEVWDTSHGYGFWWGPPWSYGLVYGPDTPGYWATVTYTGGYTSETLPITLRRAIARAALGLARTTTTTALMAGGSDLTVGDIHIGKPGSGVDQHELDTLVPGLTQTLRKWRRKTVRY